MTDRLASGADVPPAASRSLIALLPLIWLSGTILWWALAFPPLRSEPPEWLAAVQAVCFGSLPGGLPAPYGWGALIVSPLAMLAALLVGWGREIRQDWAGWRRRPWVRGALLLVGALVIAQSGWVAWSVGGRLLPAREPWQPVERGVMPADYLRLDRPAPPLDLWDQNGERLTLEQLKGRVTFLTFAFGHCATVCPTVLKNIETAAKRGDAPHPETVIITLDAWRDTPSVLAGIHRRWKLPPEMRLLSGEPARVNAVLDAYRVGRRRDERTGRIDHAALVYVLDPQSRIAYALLNPTVGWLAEAARRAGQPPSQAVSFGSNAGKGTQ